MKKNKEIANKVTKHCADATTFLTKKDSLIKERIAAIDKEVHTIENSNLTEEEKKLRYSELEKLEEELYLFEVNENDLMQEHLFMCNISNELKKFLGVVEVSFGDNSKFLSSKEEVLKAKNKELEEIFSSIDGETPEKIVARKNVVDSEKALESFNKQYVSFDGKYAALSSAITKKEEEIVAQSKVLEEMESQYNSDQLHYDDAFLNEKEAHRKTVDARAITNGEDRKREDLDSANNLFQMHNHELNEINDKLADLKDDLKIIKDEEDSEAKRVEGLSRELGVSEGKIMIQGELVSKLEKEKDWLRGQYSDESIKINSLEDKLSSWKINYKEFESLVDKIQNHYNYYPKKLSFDGESDQNPLTNLIQRVANINEWIENYEPIKPTPITITAPRVAESGISPYLVGVIALGGLAILTLKN